MSQKPVDFRHAIPCPADDEPGHCTNVYCPHSHPKSTLPGRRPPSSKDCVKGEECTRSGCTFRHTVRPAWAADTTGTAAPAPAKAAAPMAPIVDPRDWKPLLVGDLLLAGADYRSAFMCPSEGCTNPYCLFGGHADGPRKPSKTACRSGEGCRNPTCGYRHMVPSAWYRGLTEGGAPAPAPAGAGTPKEDAAGCVFLPTATNTPARRLAGAGGPSGGGPAAPAEDDDRIAAKLAKLNEYERCLAAFDPEADLDEELEDWEEGEAWEDEPPEGWTRCAVTGDFIPPVVRLMAVASAAAFVPGGAKA